MTVNVRFIDVGRARKTWESEIPIRDGVLDGDAMVKSIKKQKALASTGIDVESDGGIYVGGFRRVGSWELAEKLVMVQP